MKYSASTPDEYIKALPADKREAVSKLRNTVKANLPDGFEETMNYGMIGYVVPHSSYPNGYHCDPKLPLPFMNIAQQKNFIGFYHMGIYSDPELLEWFKTQYAKSVTQKLDMGKSCIRFKKPEQIPHKLIGQLCKKISPKKWIQIYESQIKK